MRHGLPGVESYSKESISRAVRSETFLHPLSLYPVSLGIVSGLGAFLFNAPLFFTITGAFIALAGSTALVNFFFREQAIARRYLDALTAEFAAHRQKTLKNLNRELAEAAQLPELRGHGVQGHEQMQRISKKYDHLRELLDRKLQKNELTYGRFLGAAEQVQLSVLDNLIHISALLGSIGSIDLAYIKQRQQDLRSLDTISDADKREFQTLKKRASLRQSQLGQVNQLLTENEESMTAMDETIAAVVAMRTGDKLASVDLETAMSHLRDLIAERGDRQARVDEELAQDAGRKKAVRAQRNSPSH